MLPHWRPVGSRAAGRVLTSFWQAIGACNYRIGSGSSASTQLMLDLSRLFSPYQLNPFDINPLRKIISEVIDFDALRSRRSIRLFIAATRLSTGTLKLFENAELSIDALLASACLPTFSQAIEIDGESYWDGAYSGNPAIYPPALSVPRPGHPGGKAAADATRKPADFGGRDPGASGGFSVQCRIFA